MRFAVVLFPLFVYLSYWPVVRAQEAVTEDVSAGSVVSLEMTTLGVASDLVTLEATTFASQVNDNADTLADFNGSGLVNNNTQPESTSDQPEVTVDQLEAESPTTTATIDTTTTSSGSLPEQSPSVNPVQSAEESANTTITAEATTSPSTSSTESLQNSTGIKGNTSTISTTQRTTTSLETITQASSTTTQTSSTTAQQSAETTSLPNTTVEKRSTLPATTVSTPTIHECVTSKPCVDPNAHCVSVAGRNTCQCRTGYRRNSVRSACLEFPAPTTTTASPVPSNTSPNQPNNSVNTTPSSNLAGTDSSQKKITVVRAEYLSSDEELEVVTFRLQPPISVVEWILEKDLVFRSTIAAILTSTGLQTSSNEELQNISVSSDQVLYLVPSPLLSNDKLLVSIMVENSNKVPVKPYSFRSIAARQRRALSPDVMNDTIPNYFPAIWIVQSIRQSQALLENNLNQTIPTLYGGEVPQELLYLQCGSFTLLEGRLDIFIPLFLAIALSCMVIVSLVCVKAKKRSTATWDPPAGIIFGRKPQTAAKEEREDPLGSVNRLHSSGHDLATDEQCRDGEDHHPIKPDRLNSEDDVWVVPFEGAPPSASKNAIRTQFEDTKL